MKTTIQNIGKQSPVFDLEAGDLPVDFVSDALNYRLLNKKYISFNGESLLSGTIAFFPGYVDFIQSVSGNFFLVAGRNSVRVFDGGVWTNISNVIPYGMAVGDELFWSGCKLGQIPIIANEQGFPEYWAPQQASQMMQDLRFDAASTWRSRNFKCKIIRSHKTFLFALNLTEGSTAYPNAYRWSHPADVGGLPFSWDPTDISSLASREMIGDEFIIDALTLRDSFAIYTNRGIHLLNYVGGDFVFERAEALSKTHFILASNCVVEAVGSHYFLSNGDILFNDGTNIVSVLDEKIKTYLQESMSSEFYTNCFGQINPNTKEVWFFIVQDGFQFPNLAIIINYVTSTIALRQISGSKTYAVYGPQSIAQDFWNTDSNPWNFDSAPWANNSASAPFGYALIAVDRALSGLYNQEPMSVSSYNTYVARYNLVLEGVDKETLTTITRIIPYIKASGPVSIEIGSHDFQGAPVRWKPAVVYDPNGSRKVDKRTTGMLHAWRVSSIGGTKFEFSGISFEYEVVGSRVGGFIPSVLR